jgi:polyisoprenoid-binding protein YceI
MTRLLVPALMALALSSCGAPTQPAAEAPAAAPAEAPVENTAPAGEYTLDKAHSSMIVRLSHLGYSQFRARFTTWDAHLTLDPASPENSRIRVTIDPRSIASDNPPAGFIDQMRGPDFLNAAQFSQITFESTRIERLGDRRARITGNLTLHGVTRPVTLEGKFNGGYAGIAGMDPNARVGFDAHGTFNRSDFGMGYGVPAPGTNLGVGDAVTVSIETEFTGPPLAAAPAAATP